MSMRAGGSLSLPRRGCHDVPADLRRAGLLAQHGVGSAFWRTIFSVPAEVHDTADPTIRDTLGGRLSLSSAAARRGGHVTSAHTQGHWVHGGGPDRRPGA